MLTANALVQGDHEKLLQHEGDAPCALQLGGSDPAILARAAELAEAAGYQEVNLNCGCPSDRVQQGGIGACLMARPKLVAECLLAMQESVSVPVTVKTRIGIDDQDDYAFFRRFIESLFNAGCRHFQIHARKAVLSGLSPRENREIPPLRYDLVRLIQADFPEARFVLNGGIKSPDEVRTLLEEFPGVMLGRAAYNNPFLLTELEAMLFGIKPKDRFEVLTSYKNYVAAQMAMGVHLKHTTRHLLGLFSGLPGARAFRRHLSTHIYRDDASLSVIDEAAALVRN